MIGPDTFPHRPEDVTADWMTEALSSSFPDVAVTGVEILDQHSGTTGRLRLGLSYASARSGPGSVFVKLPPFDEAQQRLVARTDMGRREARFYEGPAAEVPLRIPRALFAAHGEEPTDYVMVLEDLQAIGVAFANRLEPLGADQGGQLIEGLARLHAQFWNDRRFSDEFAWMQPAMRGLVRRSARRQRPRAVLRPVPPVFDELCRLYEEHHGRIAEVWDEGEQTLIHGDTHAGNQFLDGDQVGLVRLGRDQPLTGHPRRRHLPRQLVSDRGARASTRKAGCAATTQVLVESGVDAPSFETLWMRYRRTRPVRLGRGDHHRVHGEQVAARRGGHARHDPGDRRMRRPRDGRGAPGGSVTRAVDVFYEGLDFGEGPRWHDDRLWV